MTRLYRISYEASVAGKRSVRSKQMVGNNLDQAIDRIIKRIKRINPLATVYIHGAKVFNQDTKEWENIIYGVKANKL